MTLDLSFFVGVLLLFKLNQLNTTECNFSIKRFPGHIVLLSPELTEIPSMHKIIFTEQENNVYYLTLILAKLCTDVNFEIVECY